MNSKRTLFDIFHVSESYKLPDAIMNELLSDNAENIIRQVKKSINDDIRDIFQQEQGDRNDYNLNIPRYVDTFEPDPLPDMQVLLKEMQKIENEEKKTRKKLYKMLGALTGGTEDMDIIKEHRKLLKPQNTRNTFRQMTLEDYQNAM